MNNIQNIVKEANSVISKQEGNLVVSRCRGTIQFYHYHDNGKRDYIRKTNKSLLMTLAQKKYCKQILKVSTKLLQFEEIRQEIKDKNIETAFEQLDSVIKPYVTPFVISPETKINNWKTEPYKKSSKYPEGLKYKTDKGDLVRSKSEVIIANKLYKRNIPYRYECELKLNSKYIIYPDFTIMHPKTGRLFYLEHFGLMDNPSYVEVFLEKIKMYSQNNLLIGRNLLLTFESSAKPFDSEYLDILLNEYFGL